MSRLSELETMHDQNPNDPFLIYALAREYEQNQSTMQALLMYEHLVHDHPTYIGTYYHYSKLLYSAGNHKEAIRMIKLGLEEGKKAGDLHAVGEMEGLLSLWEEV